MSPADLTAAREALAAFDAPRCRRGMAYSAAGQTLCSLPVGHRGPHRAVYYEPSVDHLRAALAAVDELTAERDEARQIVNACMGAVPVTTVAFAGDVPLYVRSCFDAVEAEHQESVAGLVRAVDAAAERIGEVVAERDRLRARLPIGTTMLYDGEPAATLTPDGWRYVTGRYLGSEEVARLFEDGRYTLSDAAGAKS